MAHTGTRNVKGASKPAEADGETAKRVRVKAAGGGRRKNKKIDTSITVTYAQLVQQWYKMYETI